MPESMTATATPAPVSRGRLAARPHLIGPDALGGHVDAEPGVARQMLNRRVLADCGQLTGGHPEHRTAPEVPRDAQVVARRQRVHFRPRAVHDDGDRLRSGREVILEVGTQPRMAGGERRRGAD